MRRRTLDFDLLSVAASAHIKTSEASQTSDVLVSHFEFELLLFSHNRQRQSGLSSAV